MRKVLIVDDEASIRNGLPLIIDWERLGYQIVGSAENGEAGLAMIHELKPDVVIADIRMPGKNGLEMVQAASEEGLLFFAIILSGYSDFDYAKQALQLGAVTYLLKPVDEEELIGILTKIDQKSQDRSAEKSEESVDGEIVWRGSNGNQRRTSHQAIASFRGGRCPKAG